MKGASTLTSSFVTVTSYEVPKTQYITLTMIYGLESAPTTVCAGTDLKETEFYFDETRNVLYVSEFQAHLGKGTVLTIS